MVQFGQKMYDDLITNINPTDICIKVSSTQTIAEINETEQGKRDKRK